MIFAHGKGKARARQNPRVGCVHHGHDGDDGDQETKVVRGNFLCQEEYGADLTRNFLRRECCGQGKGHSTIEQSDEKEGEQNASGQVLFGIFHLFCDGGDLGDAGKGHKNQGRGIHKAGIAPGEEIFKVIHIPVGSGEGHEQGQAKQCESQEETQKFAHLSHAQNIEQHDDAQEGHDGWVEGEAGDNGEVRSQPHQGEGRLEENGQKEAQSGHRAEEGPKRSLDIDVGSATCGHGRGQLGLAHGGRQDDQGGEGEGEKEGGPGSLHADARKYENPRTNHGANTDDGDGK